MTIIILNSLVMVRWREFRGSTQCWLGFPQCRHFREKEHRETAEEGEIERSSAKFV
jgi:hypothetical protein